MSTNEPGRFTERGDTAEAAAYRGDGVYSGGEFAGGDPDRYDRLSGGPDNPDGTAAPDKTAIPSGTANPDGTANPSGTANPDKTANPSGTARSDGTGDRDIESRDLQHTSFHDSATGIGDAAGRD